MGVSFHAAGLAYEDSYDCGYATYGGYRMALANAIDSEFGTLYRAWYTNVGVEEKGDSASFRSFMYADTEEEIEAIRSLPPVNVQYAEKTSSLWEGLRTNPLLATQRRSTPSR